ncbi:variant leucine-rich repeat-containing protein [Varibaculum prostatecancerukia]|uniref:variant leucine-rich repeat-containing protein n=1 Tax=Varibaculum prostatecancerukia TaxID=2811781 RepID=UPI001C001423|nr:hypothetical protein [Varibaculum prostatecancerukia]
MNKAASSPTGKPAEQAPASYPVQLVPSPECARNHQTPPDYLRFLTQFPHLHADLALNPALPPDLEQWIKGHPDPRVQTNLRIRVQNPVAPAAANNSPLKSAGSSGTASEEQKDEDKFDATSLAGSVPPVTKSMPPEKETPPQAKAPFSPAAVPAAPGNPSSVPSTQVLPQPSAYPQRMPAAAYPPPASYPQSFPPAGSPGYQPLPGQYPRPRRKRRWLIPLIAVIAVLAIIGGGIGAYFAFAGFKHVGYDSPEELADALKASLDESDLIGIAQMSAPSEDVIVEDALQLDEDLQKYISTADSKSQGESGSLMDKVSDLTSVMQNLELDTSGLSSKVDNLSDDISRLNYSGRIDVKIKDRDKLKASLDKLFFDNQSAPEKEKNLNGILDKFKDMEKDGIELKSRYPYRVMAVKEDGKWYYSVPMTFFDSKNYSPDDSRYENPHYDVNWVDPGETPSDSGQFAKELSGAITRVSNLDELTSEDCMRFLDMPERRIVMVYASPEAKGDMSPGMDLKISLSEDKKSSYGFAFDLDNLTIDVDDMGWEITSGEGTYSDQDGKQTLDFGDYVKNGKLQLVAKSTKQGLKLSFSGSLANFFNNLDYDLGNEYFQENKDEYDRDYERQIEEDPFQRPYKKLILGYRGLGKKVDAETDREEYNYD